eukprot:4487362-Alexandrium_andersonii.AAC.1
MPAHPEPDMRCRIARSTARAPLPMATPQKCDRSDRSDRKQLIAPLPMANHQKRDRIDRSDWKQLIAPCPRLPPKRAIAAIGAIGSN